MGMFTAWAQVSPQTPLQFKITQTIEVLVRIVLVATIRAAKLVPEPEIKIVICVGGGIDMVGSCLTL